MKENCPANSRNSHVNHNGFRVTPQEVTENLILPYIRIRDIVSFNRASKQSRIIGLNFIQKLTATLISRKCGNQTTKNDPEILKKLIRSNLKKLSKGLDLTKFSERLDLTKTSENDTKKYKSFISYISFLSFKTVTECIKSIHLFGCTDTILEIERQNEIFDPILIYTQLMVNPDLINIDIKKCSNYENLVNSFLIKFKVNFLEINDSEECSEKAIQEVLDSIKKIYNSYNLISFTPEGQNDIINFDKLEKIISDNLTSVTQRVYPLCIGKEDLMNDIYDLYKTTKNYQKLLNFSEKHKEYLAKTFQEFIRKLQLDEDGMNSYEEIVIIQNNIAKLSQYFNNINDVDQILSSLEDTRNYKAIENLAKKAPVLLPRLANTILDIWQDVRPANEDFDDEEDMEVEDLRRTVLELEKSFPGTFRNDERFDNLK